MNILTHANPDQQAQGILHEISAEEKGLRMQVQEHPDAETTQSTLTTTLKADQDTVRKKLELSGRRLV